MLLFVKILRLIKNTAVFDIAELIIAKSKQNKTIWDLHFTLFETMEVILLINMNPPSVYLSLPYCFLQQLAQLERL